MSILTKHILGKYLKFFFIILVSLEVFFVGIDFLQNINKLPQSANLQLLYLLYNSFFTLTITLPLSLVFAWIVTITIFIKNNELVSFYALGIPKGVVLKPVIVISTLITMVLITLHATPLAYSYEEKKKILNNEYFVSVQSNIFLKYNEYFVYFKKLYPLEKKAVDIHIFKTKNNDVVETIVGKKAYYQNNKWYVIDTKITKKPEKIDWNKSKLEVSYEKFLYTLEGFEPEIINNVYKAKIQFSILDAVKAILVLEDQEFNTSKIKAILYAQTIMPFFIIPVMILIFVFSGISSRFFNAARFISITIFLSLCSWGIMFLLQKLSLGGVIMAELAIIAPVLLLFITTYFIYTKKVS